MRNIQITGAITNSETASVDRYFNDINKAAMVSPQEEVELAQKIRQGDQAALDKLVKANLRFVISVAKKYQYQGLPLGDLINEGNLGLIKAAHRFDETRGFKFISFAVWWIRQHILLAIVENARIIRLPMNKVGEITRINKAIIDIEQKTLREPTPEQLAEYLEMDIGKVKDALGCASWTASYDTSANDDGYCMLDYLAGDESPTDEGLIAESQAFEMRQLLSVLSEREATIIKLTYGMTGGWEMSPFDISKQIGLSSERVRQIRNDALEKLRNPEKNVPVHV